jgi:hypothetical protein
MAPAISISAVSVDGEWLRVAGDEYLPLMRQVVGWLDAGRVRPNTRLVVADKYAPPGEPLGDWTVATAVAYTKGREYRL